MNLERTMKKTTKFKKGILIAATLLVMAFVCGCGCKHEWIEATCTEPKTCKLCGATEGEALGHTWEEATCETPKTCSVCGATEGEALGHTWEEATCETPKTCSVCGATEGEALGHDFAPATLESPKTCRVCGATEGEPLKLSISEIKPIEGTEVVNSPTDNIIYNIDQIDDYIYEMQFADYNGNLLYTQEIETDSFFWTCVTGPSSYAIVASMGGKRFIEIYDYEGDLLYEEEREIYVNKLGVGKSYDGLIRWTYQGETLVCLDINQNKECSEEEYNAAQGVNAIAYDPTQWASYLYEEAIDGYVVGKADYSAWGYLDKAGNEIAMYKDATSYLDSGYALVSEDGNTYDLIDAEQNIIAENITEGRSARGAYHGFIVYLEDGSCKYITLD